MPDNVNTEPENHRPLLDAEDWEISLEPYRGNPRAALTMAFSFMTLKSFLIVRPTETHKAIKGLDLAIEVLFPYTKFHEFSYEMFLKVLTGRLSFEEEQLLRSLGLQFEG